MNVVRRNAYAKLNLTLDITGEEGGYHLLDSLAVTVDLSDRVVLRRRRDGLVTAAMHGMGSESIPFEENNAVRAAERFRDEFHTRGVDITVYKNIPIGAGLGGSSSDAAAVIAGMGAMFSVKQREYLPIAAEIGSDVPFLLDGGLARMRGRGEVLERLPFLPLSFLLLVPGQGVGTAECYREYDRRGETFAPCTEAALSALFSGKKGEFPFENHLFSAACALLPAVRTAYEEAAAFSPLAASMTGSGSAAFALFETRELAEWAASRYTGKFRAIVAKSVDPGKIQASRSPFRLSEEEGTEEDRT